MAKKMAERRRKSSLHAFVSTKALHLKQNVFFTSSPNRKPCLLSCSRWSQVKTFRFRFTCEVAACRRVDVFLFTALRLQVGVAACRRTKPHLSAAALAKVEGFTSRFCVNKSSSLKTECFLRIFWGKKDGKRFLAVAERKKRINQKISEVQKK